MGNSRKMLGGSYLASLAGRGSGKRNTNSGNSHQNEYSSVVYLVYTTKWKRNSNTKFAETMKCGKVTTATLINAHAHADAVYTISIYHQFADAVRFEKFPLQFSAIR